MLRACSAAAPAVVSSGYPMAMRVAMACSSLPEYRAAASALTAIEAADRQAHLIPCEWEWPSDEAEFARPADGIGAALRRELAEDRPDVCLDGVDRDEHLRGDLLRPQVRVQVHEDLGLPLRQRLNDEAVRMTGSRDGACAAGRPRSYLRGLVPGRPDEGPQPARCLVERSADPLGGREPDGLVERGSGRRRVAERECGGAHEQVVVDPQIQRSVGLLRDSTRQLPALG